MQRQQYPSRLANTGKNASTADNTSSTAESEEAEHLRLSQDLICSHPLYPLLSSIFEKCELSTCASRDPPPTATASPDTEASAAATAGDADGCSSSSFDQDIANFARELDASNAGAFTGDQDLDSVMIQAIQVLRFHLLELEKVHELCDNFCSRYITCLRGKMMLSDAVQPQQQQPLGSVPVASMSGFSSSPQSETEATASSSSILQPPLGLPHPYQQPVADQASIILPAPPTPLPPPLLASAGHEHPVQLSMPTDTGIAFEGFESSLASGENVQDELLHNGTDEMVPGSAGAASSSDSVDEVTVPARQRQQRKRGIFPKCATNVMRAWLFQHLSHPYPSEEQKKQLAADTGLTILQVNNWFINARRRIVQPMIDQSNQPGPHDFGPESVFTSSYAAAMEAQQQPQQLCYSGAGFPVPQVSLEAAAAAAAVGFPSYHPAPPVPPAAYPQPLHEHHHQQQQQQQVPFPPACFGRHSNRRSFGQLQKQESFSTD